MKISENVTQLQCPFNNIIFRLRSGLFQNNIQRSSFNVVHYYNETVLIFDNINDTGKIGMIQFLKSLDLSHKTRTDHVEIHSSVFADFLNSPCLISLLVDSHVNNAHSAMANFTQDLISAVY